MGQLCLTHGSFACVYRVVDTKIFYAKGNFHFKKFLGRSGIEPATLRMIVMNTRALTTATT